MHDRSRRAVLIIALGLAFGGWIATAVAPEAIVPARPAPGVPGAATHATVPTGEAATPAPSAPEPVGPAAARATPAPGPAPASAVSGGAAGTEPLVARVLPTASGPLEVIADEALVALRPGATEADVARVATETGTEVRAWRPHLGLARLAWADGADPRARAAELARHPLVAAARPHALARGAADVRVVRPEGTYTIMRDGVKNAYRVRHPDGHAELPVLEPLQWAQITSRGPRAAEVGVSGEGIVVAVLDTGVAYEDRIEDGLTFVEAPDLVHVSFVQPRDVVHGDGHANDDNGHGTLMTALVAGFGATVSLAPNVAIMPVKVLDAGQVGTELDLVDGLDWAVARGADVISMSLAFSPGYRPTPWLEAAVEAAAEAGVVMVASSGNDGADTVSYPARMRRVVAVGAYRAGGVSRDTGRLGQPAIASYGNFGLALDLLGPGGDLAADRDADGVPDGLVGQSFPPGEPDALGWWVTAGTSPAAAVASATVALLLDHGVPPDGVRQVLMESAPDVPDLAGRPDPGAFFNSTRGAGALSAGGAMDNALWWPSTAGCDSIEVFVNPTGMFTEQWDGTHILQVFVEVLDGSLRPIPSARVHMRLRGVLDAEVSGWVGSNGVWHYRSPSFTVPPDGVGVSAEIEAVQLTNAACGTGQLVARPLMVSRVDEASYRLASSLGTGLASSALVLFVDPTAAATMPTWDTASYRATYLSRSLGTGLASSALVGFYDARYLETSGLLRDMVVFRTFGSGLASSAITFDEALFAPDVLEGYTPTTVLARGYLSGSGLASSALTVGDDTLAWDAYVPQVLDPAVIWLHYGTGLASSALVLDRGLLSPDLYEEDAGVLETRLASGGEQVVSGRGLASSALVLDLSPSSALVLGFDYAWVTDVVLTGAALASSALALGYGAPDAGGGSVLQGWMSGLGLASSALVTSWSPTSWWLLPSTETLVVPLEGAAASVGRVPLDPP